MKLKAITYYISYIGMLIAGCKSPDQHSNSFNADRYIGHLALDSSVVILTEVGKDLEIPWDLSFSADGWIWFTEQKGTVSRIYPDSGEKKVLLEIPHVLYKKSMGLTSMALHPAFEQYPYVYLHYTFASGTQHESIHSRIVRYTFQQDTLVSPFVLIDSIPGKTYHNGSRMVITSDEKLFFAMGDAGEKELAQKTDHLNGKILRLNLDGTIPEDNPFKGNPVWSWGHRNPQGLVYTSNNFLISTEHGVNDNDEVNLIEKGRNYGWPYVEGFCDLLSEKVYCKDSSITEPIFTWSPTVAVAGMDHYNHPEIPEWKNSLLLGNLKGRALRVLKLNDKGNGIISEQIFFQKRFGRIRDVCVADNGDIYFSTSNLDWHPQLQSWMYDTLPTGGDRIIRLQFATSEKKRQLDQMETKEVIHEDTVALEMAMEVWDFEVDEKDVSEGQTLYMQHCAPCHLPDGKGVKDLFPPLADTEWVTGNKSRLIQVMLKGLSVPIEVRGTTYEQEMPAFAYLSDEEIADILTYVRNSFGNNARAVIPGEIHEERKGL